MSNQISLDEYLEGERRQLSAWGGTARLRLEVLMDYSRPFNNPTLGPHDDMGQTAVRWSVLADSLGNGLTRATGLKSAQAILVAFVYSKILTIDAGNRRGLFSRVATALRESANGGSFCGSLQAWHLSTPTDAGEIRETAWPWEFVDSWNELEAARPSAHVTLGGSVKCLSHAHTATLLSGPRTQFAPQGWWLQLERSSPDLAGVLLPAFPLIAITHFLQHVEGDSQDLLLNLLHLVSLYYGSPDRIPFGAEALAVSAALKTIAEPENGGIDTYRRRDEAVLRGSSAAALPIAPPRPSGTGQGAAVLNAPQPTAAMSQAARTSVTTQSGGVAREFSWLCPQCKRDVPNRLHTCECGYNVLEVRRRAAEAARRAKQKSAEETADGPFSSLRLLFSNRSWPWWTGAVCGFVFMLLTNLPRQIALPAVLCGGLLGDLVASWSQRLESDLEDELKRARLRRRAMLVAGVFMFVWNMFPTEFDSTLYWPTSSRLLVALGAVLIVLAFATKPKEQPF